MEIWSNIMSPPDYKNITTHNNIPSALVMSSVLTVMENLDILRVQEGRNPSNQDWMTMIQIQSQRPKKNAKQTCEFDPKSAFCACTRKRMKAAKVLNFWTVLWSVFILYGLTYFQSHIKYFCKIFTTKWANIKFYKQYVITENKSDLAVA